MGKFAEDLGTSRLPGKTSVNPFFPPTSNAASNRSQAWGGEGLGRLNMKHGEGFGLPMCFPRIGWKGSMRRGLGVSWGGAAQCVPGRVWVFHGSQEWGGKGLGRLTQGFGLPIRPNKGAGRA